ncbi:MAG: DUF3368 domain-containing protein [Candidatus Bathyarchaeota archaeon]|nr:DUF3368 domain-containing protein [Candidatus Bathyarchaeota archaeon]
MSKNKQYIVVSNSTPLIYLAKIGRLNILREVFGEVYIPNAVFEETVSRGKALNISDAYIIEKAVGNWLIKEQIKPEINREYHFLDTNTKLGLGEREALKLCKQLKAKYFIVDDKAARQASKMLNVTPTGTCSVVIQACKQRVITKNEATKIIEDLLKAGFRIDLEVYGKTLHELGSKN